MTDDDPDYAHDERVSENLHAAAERAAAKKFFLGEWEQTLTTEQVRRMIGVAPVSGLRDWKGEFDRWHAADRAKTLRTAVTHIYGFARDGEVRGVSMSLHEGRSVIEVARGVIAHTTEREHTELVRFQRTWPLDGYGQEWAVTQVDAVTRTTLDGGETWLEMWHCFTTPSEPWTLADVADSVLRDAVAEDIARDRAMEHNSECDPWPCTNDDCPCECHV